MKQKGFSLIELLVVVAIIGILAAVGVVAYNGYTTAAKVSASKANHIRVVKVMNADLLRCEIGEEKLKYLNHNNIWEETNCNSKAIFFESHWKGMFKNLNMMNPYSPNLYGLDHLNDSIVINERYYIGVVKLVRMSSDRKECNNNSCCFHVQTYYRKTDQTYGDFLEDWVLGNTCQK